MHRTGVESMLSRNAERLVELVIVAAAAIVLTLTDHDVERGSAGALANEFEFASWYKQSAQTPNAQENQIGTSVAEMARSIGLLQVTPKAGPVEPAHRTRC